MNTPDHIAALPALAPEKLQEEIAPVREYQWKTSWLERLVMLAIPLIALMVFQLTTYSTDSQYCVCSDEEYFPPVHAERALNAFNMPRHHLLGIVVSEPLPLISKEALKQLTLQRRGLAVLEFDPRYTVYPQSLITQTGQSTLAFNLSQRIITGLLLCWLLISTWNLVRFGRYRMRQRNTRTINTRL